MKPIYRIGAATLLVAALGLQGCAMGTNSNSAYSSGQAQREQTVRFGTVDSVRNVVIDREQTGVGTIAGGANMYTSWWKVDAGQACALPYPYP